MWPHSSDVARLSALHNPSLNTHTLPAQQAKDKFTGMSAKKYQRAAAAASTLGPSLPAPTAVGGRRAAEIPDDVLADIENPRKHVRLRMALNQHKGGATALTKDDLQALWDESLRDKKRASPNTRTRVLPNLKELRQLPLVKMLHTSAAVSAGLNGPVEAPTRKRKGAAAGAEPPAKKHKGLYAELEGSKILTTLLDDNLAQWEAEARKGLSAKLGLEDADKLLNESVVDKPTAEPGITAEPEAAEVPGRVDGMVIVVDTPQSATTTTTMDTQQPATMTTAAAAAVLSAAAADKPLHPLDRVTARFRCTKCSKVQSHYREEECMPFKGVCAHECDEERVGGTHCQVVSE